MSARAALDAARTEFEPSLGRPPIEATTTPEWREHRAGLESPHARGRAMWNATEQVLHVVVGRAALTGQALVGEARRRQFLTLGDAHALMALQGWMDRLREVVDADAPPGDHERMIAREAWTALEHAVDVPMAAPSQPSVADSFAVPVANVAAVVPPVGGADAWDAAGVRPARPWYATTAFVFGVLMVVVIGSAVAWLFLAGRGRRDFDEGLAAYARGAREVARTAFAKAAQDHPDDARPLVYLGRLAREENDLVRARRFLDAAVRIDPANALAQRELAAALLADGQPELARRFYVRALELDPSDRLAQGFLGCALYRLGRLDEAGRWAARAGSGEWTACMTAPAFVTPPITRAPPP